MCAARRRRRAAASSHQHPLRCRLWPPTHTSHPPPLLHRIHSRTLSLFASHANTHTHIHLCTSNRSFNTPVPRITHPITHRSLLLLLPSPPPTHTVVHLLCASALPHRRCPTSVSHSLSPSHTHTYTHTLSPHTNTHTQSLSMADIKVKWGKETLAMQMELSSTVGALKLALSERTGVPTEKQKLMGLKPNANKDDATLRDAGITAGKTIMLIGSAESAAALPVVQAAVVAENETGGFTATTATSNGLRNIANTCYLNSALQMLRSVPEIREVLTGYRGESALLRQLGGVLQSLEGTKDAVVPLQFWTTLMQTNPTFAERDEHGGFMQQDAQEVLNMLLQAVSPALPAKYAHLFTGKLHQVLTCVDDPADKGKESTVPFTMLSCNITGEVQTLEAGLERAFDEHFTAPCEALQKDAAQFTRVSRLSEAPEYVFVHMVRFSWRADIQKKAKILKPITFPIVLDTALIATEALKAAERPQREIIRERRDKELEKRRRPRTETGSAPTEAAEPEQPESVPLTLVNESGYYELCGVISHKGRSADGGHYVYWGKKANTWLIYDDENVAAVSEEDVRRLRGVGEAHIAYVLLYRSRDPVTRTPVIPI
ncbi:ubiquitin carboxyl-terminal hydrolase [Novymonas esmeraldas]|uniref:Ubiquitin carboxyl-terminal hydrolase n=1 Tax=Novymonas esmeraldas TaxID=1808958 RepID=A0AAW0EXD5_9TRYP